MNSQDLLAQRSIHAGEALDERLRPGLPEKHLSAKMKAGGLEDGGEVGERNFLPERPIRGGGFMDAPLPIPVAQSVGNQDQHVAAAAAGHASQQGRLLVEGVMLDHAGVEYQIERGVARIADIAQNKVGGELF